MEKHAYLSKDWAAKLEELKEHVITLAGSPMPTLPDPNPAKRSLKGGKTLSSEPLTKRARTEQLTGSMSLTLPGNTMCEAPIVTTGDAANKVKIASIEGDLLFIVNSSDVAKVVPAGTILAHMGKRACHIRKTKC